MENNNNTNNMLGGGSAGSATLNTNSLLGQQQFGGAVQQQQLGSGQHGVRDELSGGMVQQQQQLGGSNDIRSPSSAFTTVNKFSDPNQQFGNSGGEENNSSSPPFNMANVANGLERSSDIGIGLSGIGGVAAGMGRNSATGGSAEGGGRVMRKYQPRETSLLVSPIPQSDAFNNNGGGRGNSSVDAPGSAGSRSHVAAINQQQQQYGPTGTPSTGLQQQQPQGADATPQQYSGRDPTPYHYRSNPSTSSSANNNNNKKKTSSSGSKESVASTTSSSRSGLDPPAKSPFPTSIHAHHTTTSSSQNNSSSSLRTPNGMMMGRESQQQQQGYTTGYATNNSTPNVNSHHYQHLMAVEQQHQQLRENNIQQQVELSMIQEDTVADHHHHGMAVGNDEMSHVTGSSTFVRTPNVLRKGQQYTPKNTSYYTTTPGSTTSATVIATAATGNNNNDNTTSDDSPSMVMRRELDNLASQTSNTLDEIWDCVGVPHEERINQFHDLVEQFQVVFDAVINKEEGMRIQFTKEIDEARSEWKSICLALKLNEEDPVRKMKRDPSSKDVTSHTTLQVEYETLDLRLQALRKIKNVAMSDMEVSRGRICEAFAALNGCTVEEAHTSSELHSFMDIVSDLTDARREEFRSKALEYEESVNSRTKAIVSLIMDCQSMIRELEIEPPSMEAVGYDEDDAKIMNSLSRADDDEAESSRDDDQQPPQLRRGNSNDYTMVDLFESSTCMGISTSSLDRLTTRIAELNGEKRRRRARLAEMGATISSLWQMLRVPSEEQRAFTTSIRGLGLDTIRKGEAEIVRLEELKAVMIGKLVREQRDMIEELWDKTNSSVAERSSFNTYFHITNEERLTSDILIKHEEYVSSLKAKLDKMQPILDLIAKRETIIDERSELEILQKDPDRLQRRGAAKQLAKEEKMSRRVTKELPKITGILEKTLRQWYVENKPNKNEEEEEGQVVDPDLGHFIYQGIPYLQTMKHQDEEWRTRKERAEEERQRKREEERTASSAANRAFGYTNTYTKLPGKKTSYNSRPRSASNIRSGSSTSARSGSNLRSGGARPTSSSSTRSDRFGGRGPLGDVSSSKQNTSRPPSRPRGGGDHQGGKKVVAGGRGYRPASAPRMRL